MRLIRPSFALVVALGLTAPASAAPTTGTKTLTQQKKHHGHVIHGTVTDVSGSSGKATLKVKVHNNSFSKKKQNTTAAASATKSTTTKKTHTVTVHLNTKTKIDKVSQANGKTNHQKSQFGEVKTGQHVRVHYNKTSHHAHAVHIKVAAKKGTTTTTTKKPTTPKKKKNQ